MCRLVLYFTVCYIWCRRSIFIKTNPESKMQHVVWLFLWSKSVQTVPDRTISEQILEKYIKKTRSIVNGNLCRSFSNRWYVELSNALTIYLNLRPDKKTDDETTHNSDKLSKKVKNTSNLSRCWVTLRHYIILDLYAKRFGGYVTALPHLWRILEMQTISQCHIYS